MGIHEVDGYGRLFASIGLAPELADFFGIKNYCGLSAPDSLLQNWMQSCERGLAARLAQPERTPARLTGTSGLMREYRRQPYVWSTAGKVARREERYENFIRKLFEIEEAQPVALRHLLDLQERAIVSRNLADTKIGTHNAPIFFAACRLVPRARLRSGHTPRAQRSSA